MKKTLKLQDFEVKSFTTSQQNHVSGGSYSEPTNYPDCGPSLDINFCGTNFSCGIAGCAGTLPV